MRKSPVDALFPEVRRDILSACLLHPDRWYYHSDLAASLGRPPSSLQRELNALTAAGILKSRTEGRLVYYQADLACVVIQELQSLMIKTTGIAEVLQRLLRPHLHHIRTAFVYGSIARAEEVATSDADVLIIGNIKLKDLAQSLRRAERAIGREINPTIFSPPEFERALRTGDAFLRTIMADDKIILFGSVDESSPVAGQKRSSGRRDG